MTEFNDFTTEPTTVQNDSHSDYHAVKDAVASEMKRGVHQNRFQPRFQPFAQRHMRSDLSDDSIKSIANGKHFMHYRGVPMAKDPLDKTLYEMLMHEIQPKTIIELGAYTGASAQWLWDLGNREPASEASRHQPEMNQSSTVRVIAADIDLSLVHPPFRNAGQVEFRQGDCGEIEQLFPRAELEKLIHPVLLIDDAHVNLPAVYQYFHENLFQQGDYLIVEDTNPCIPGTFGETGESPDWGDWKHKEIRDFFELHDEVYGVDRYYTDFFGYNATWNWNGFLRVLKNPEILSGS